MIQRLGSSRYQYRPSDQVYRKVKASTSVQRKELQQRARDFAIHRRAVTLVNRPLLCPRSKILRPPPPQISHARVLGPDCHVCCRRRTGIRIKSEWRDAMEIETSARPVSSRVCYTTVHAARLRLIAYASSSSTVAGSCNACTLQGRMRQYWPRGLIGCEHLSTDMAQNSVS